MHPLPVVRSVITQYPHKKSTLLIIKQKKSDQVKVAFFLIALITQLY